MNQGTNGCRPAHTTHHGLPHELAGALAGVPRIYLLSDETGHTAARLTELAGQGDRPVVFLGRMQPDATPVADALNQGSEVVIVAEGLEPANRC